MMQVSDYKVSHKSLSAKKLLATKKLSTVLRGVRERIQIERGMKTEFSGQREIAMRSWVAELNSIRKNDMPNAQLNDMREILRRVDVVEIYLDDAKNHPSGKLAEIRTEFSNKPPLV
jgi:hypothetical protein